MDPQEFKVGDYFQTPIKSLFKVVKINKRSLIGEFIKECREDVSSGHWPGNQYRIEAKYLRVSDDYRYQFNLRKVLEV